MYDMGRNTYRFLQDGKHITLVGLTLAQSHADQCKVRGEVERDKQESEMTTLTESDMVELQEGPRDRKIEMEDDELKNAVDIEERVDEVVQYEGEKLEECVEQMVENIMGSEEQSFIIKHNVVETIHHEYKDPYFVFGTNSFNCVLLKSFLQAVHCTWEFIQP